MKKAIALLSAFLIAAPAFASTQILMGSAGTVTATGYSIFSASASNNSGVHDGNFPISGTISNLMFHVTNQPGGVTTRTVLIRKNASATTLTCTVASGSNTCIDSTHTVSVVAGDYVQLSASSSGTPVGTEGRWSMVFTPTNSNETVLLTANANNGNGAYTYFYWNTGMLNGSAATTQMVMPEGGTIDLLNVSSANFTGGSYDLTLIKNTASTTLTCNADQSTDACTDSTHTVSVSQGDTIQLNQNPNTPTGGLRAGIGVRFAPSTPGDFIFQSSVNGNDSAGNTRYVPFSGTAGGVSVVEASTTQVTAADMTITSVSVKRRSAPGSSKTATYTLRVNGADSSLSCTVSGAAQTDNTCTGSVSVSAGDLLAWSDTLSASSVISGTAIAVVANTGGTPPSNSCTYSGSGDWNILGSDHCYITGDTYITGALNFIGTGWAGLAGTIAAHGIHGSTGFLLYGLNGTARLYTR